MNAKLMESRIVRYALALIVACSVAGIACGIAAAKKVGNDKNIPLSLEIWPGENNNILSDDGIYEHSHPQGPWVTLGNGSLVFQSTALRGLLIDIAGMPDVPPRDVYQVHPMMTDPAGVDFRGLDVDGDPVGVPLRIAFYDGDDIWEIVLGDYSRFWEYGSPSPPVLVTREADGEWAIYTDGPSWARLFRNYRRGGKGKRITEAWGTVDVSLDMTLKEMAP